MDYFLSSLGAVAVCAAFYALGKYHERIAWNDLVEKGVLPKPRKSRH